MVERVKMDNDLYAHIPQAFRNNDRLSNYKNSFISKFVEVSNPENIP